MDVAMNDVRPTATTSAATAPNSPSAYAAHGAITIATAAGSREVWRAPLSRGDSTVSARDSKYWLSIASSSSSASARSLAPSTISEVSPSAQRDDAVHAAAVLSTMSAPVDLRRQTILPIPITIPVPSPIDKLQYRQQATNMRQNLSTSPLKYSDAGEFLNPFQFTRVVSTAVAAECIGPQSPDATRSSTASSRSRRNSSEFYQTIVAEEVYEHQRYQMVLGWGAKGHLLPLDPGKYMRAIRRPLRRGSAASGTRRAAIHKSRRRRSLGDFTFGSPHMHRNPFELCRGGGGGETENDCDEGDNDDGMDPDDGGEDADAENCDIEWVHSPVFPDIALPETGDTNAVRWEWISPWHLEFPPRMAGDLPADADGWQYSTSFQHFSRLALSGDQRLPVAGSPSGEQQRKQSQSSGITSPVGSPGNLPLVSPFWRPKHYVRCRKWVRYRRLRAAATAGAATAVQCQAEDTVPEVNAFDDSFLDSMSGWLRKLGHVRKNWKSRYFVLEKSVLRYYADESMARLKGEVLLFHPATRVHYVDIHLSGGKDCTFAIHVGKDYALLLQAEQLSDRENWMYCIEDALLCRDSYHQDPEQARGLRESVALRRKLSSESMVFNNGAAALTGTSAGIHPLNLLILDSKTIVKKAALDSHVMRLMTECDAFLDSKHMKQLALVFMQKFKQKYAVTQQANNNVDNRRRSITETPAQQQQQRGSTSFGACDSPSVAVLHDARSLLALKNYRFFIERSLATVLSHLSQLPFVTGSPITSPRGLKSLSSPKPSPVDDAYDLASTPLVSEDEWQLVRKAALYKLERMTFIPLQDVIYNLLESTVSTQELEGFEHNRRHLGLQTQAFFEIPASHASSSQWKSAISLLNTMDNYSLPCEKSAVLLEVAKCIYEIYANEHALEPLATSPVMMAADDFLPIFICILSRCSLRNVVVARHLVSETMISAMMIGETGYYATMLEAAVGYIASFEVPAEQ